MSKLTPICLCVSLVAACSSGPTPTGDAGSDAASSSDSGDSGGAGCPTVVLPTTLPLTYDGDTTGKPDLVASTRLEWGSAPDDALLFVAPAAGTYTVAMTADPSNNGGCGASAQEYASVGTSTCYDETSCPAPGTTKTIDGVYTATAGASTDLALAANQHVLLFVSCTTWSSAQFGAYTLTITKK